MNIPSSDGRRRPDGHTTGHTMFDPWKSQGLEWRIHSHTQKMLYRYEPKGEWGASRVPLGVVVKVRYGYQVWPQKMPTPDPLHAETEEEAAQILLVMEKLDE